MSKSFYKSKQIPKLLWASNSSTTTTPRRRTIQVWTTTCIVTNFGKNLNLIHDHQSGSHIDGDDKNVLPGSTVLINPSNPELSGVSNFPYFPRGGPVPKDKPKSMHADWQPLGYVSNWGGMEVGTGMLYPSSVVDGLVHQLGGKTLEVECKLLHKLKGGCPIGTAVKTYTGGKELKDMFDTIIHTTPPFYNNQYNDNDSRLDSKEILGQCYRNSISLAFSSSSTRNSNIFSRYLTLDNQGQEQKRMVVACPLLGAGARGFPMGVAVDVAAKSSVQWISEEDDDDGVVDGVESILAFGIPEPNDAELLSNAIEKELS